MSEPPRSMPYAMVPRVVIEDPEVSHGAVRMYAAARLWVNRNTGVAFPRVRTLARLLGTDRRSVQRWMAQLERRGHIIREPKSNEKGGQTSNTYVFPSFPKVGGAVETTAGGAVESAGGPAVKRTAPNKREVEVEKLNILSGTEGSTEKSARLNHGEDTSLVHCIIPGCTEEQQSQGACYVHYGDPLHEKLIGRPAK